MDSVLYICVILCIYDICIIMYLCIMYFFQVKFCKRNPGFMDSVRLGAVRAIDECQYQVSSTLVFFPCITMMRWYMGISVIQMCTLILGIGQLIMSFPLQFRARRWNCSSLQDSLDQQVDTMFDCSYSS